MAVNLKDQEMTITEHLEDLRRCLIISLIGLVVGTAIIWSWSGEFLHWLAKPVGGLIFLAPTEAFFNRLKVALYGGFILSLPVILHQVWTFIACAVDEKFRRGVGIVIPISFFLFLAGISLAVFIVVPTAVGFLISYGSDMVKPQLAVGAYLDFVTMLSMAFGAVFQIPLLLLFLNRAGVVSQAGLKAKRRYIYFGGFIAAAMLTPGPDVFSQLALALPIIILFEASLVAMRWMGEA